MNTLMHLGAIDWTIMIACFGFLPLVLLGLHDIGWWPGLQAALNEHAWWGRRTPHG